MPWPAVARKSAGLLAINASYFCVRRETRKLAREALMDSDDQHTTLDYSFHKLADDMQLKSLCKIGKYEVAT